MYSNAYTAMWSVKAITHPHLSYVASTVTRRHHPGPVKYLMCNSMCELYGNHLGTVQN